MDTKTTDARSLIGTTLDNRYRIESVVGEGGMSTVYRATHVFLKREVAVKVMQNSLTDSSDSFLRFQREAQAAATLSHPNIVSVTEFGVAETGEPYMVMDYLEGQSLSDLLKSDFKPKPMEALEIFKQVAAGLMHAHDKGILHRDLKPSNVMLIVGRPGEPLQAKVVDLGLARFLPHTGQDQHRLTAAGQLVGSPFYMSPEQIRDEELDARSDIYSFGCLMYETCTGRRPFDDSNVISVLSMHLYDKPPSFVATNPGCKAPKSLEAVVHKCLEKVRAKRYQTIADLLNDLNKITPWSEVSIAPGSAQQASQASAAARTPGSTPSPASPAPQVDLSPPQSAPASNTAFPAASNQQAQSQQNAANQKSGSDTISVALDKMAPNFRTATGARSQAIPKDLASTGTIEINNQYTLHIERPAFVDNPALGLIHRLNRSLIKLVQPTINKFKGNIEGKGVEARKQRITGTRVLIAVLGDNEELGTAAKQDFDKYKVYYKKCEFRKAMTVQEFLVLLSTESFEIIHLHGNFGRTGIFKESSHFALRLSDIRRACSYANVKLLWLASTNNCDWVRGDAFLADPPFHIVLTAARGENFPKFLSSLLARMTRGESLSSIWTQYVPYIQWTGDKTDCRSVPAIADLILLP